MQDGHEQLPQNSAEKRENILFKYPETPFRISDNEKDQPFIPILEGAKAALEPSWRGVEDSVMGAFEAVTRSRWSDTKRQNGIPVTFTAIEQSHSHPLRLGVRDKGPQATKDGRRNEIRTSVSLLGSLVHELGHNFMNESDRNFMMSNFSKQIYVEDLSSEDEKKERKKIVIREAYTELVWKGVVDQVFHPKQVAQWLQRRKEAYEGRVFTFIHTLSEEDKRMILDRDYRQQVLVQEHAIHQDTQLKRIRKGLRAFFMNDKS